MYSICFLPKEKVHMRHYNYSSIFTFQLLMQTKFNHQSNGSAEKKSACNTGDINSTVGSGRSPGGGNGNSLQVLLPEKSHGQRSLGGYCTKRHFKKSNTTEHSTHTQY